MLTAVSSSQIQCSAFFFLLCDDLLICWCADLDVLVSMLACDVLMIVLVTVLMTV
jgi:hypothetical protein